MSDQGEERRAAQVRWLVVGRFTPAAAGRRFPAGANDFAEAMKGAALTVNATVNDRFAGHGRRTFEVSFARVSSFSPAEVVAHVPTLRTLRALADEAGSVVAAEPFLDKVKAAAGDGALVSALRETLGGPATAAPVPAAPAASGSASVDDIFSKVDAPVTSSSTGGLLDAFVRSLRGGETTGKPKAGAAAARELLLNVVQTVALDILGSPEVAPLEANWRGLKLLAELCTSASSMHLTVVDAPMADAARLLGQHAEDDPFERPDALFVVDEPADLASLAALADAAETVLCPAVVGVPRVLTPDGEGAAVASWARDVDKLGEAWDELRQNEATRWLSVVANRMVLVSDGAGAHRRTVFGSPVFGVAALLCASYRETGTFGRLFGTTGSIKGPGLYEIPSGRNQGTMIPVETFLSIEGQGRVTQLGFVGLGSGRNSDKLILSAAPTLRRSSDAVPLPSQLLTGRIVRFSQWARDQIPPGSSDAEVAAIVKQAADVFLFPSPQMGQLDAKLVDAPGGVRTLAIGASVRGDANAGITPFQLAFTLTLR